MPPKFVLVKLLIEPLNRTSASVAVGPRTALKLLLLLAAACPTLFLMEKAWRLLASPPQVCPSEAVPQSRWLGRLNISCATCVTGGGVARTAGAGMSMA